MKTFKLISLFIFLTPIGVFCQISLGLRGGLALNNTTSDTRNIEFTSTNLAPAVYGGLCANFGLSDYMFLRTEINYSTKGYAITKYYDAQRFQTGNTQYASFWGVNYSYIQVPIVLNYAFESENFKFYVGAGPYFSYAFAGKKWADLFIADLGGEFLNVKSVSEPYSFVSAFGSDNRKDNRLDVGAVFNVGIARKLQNGDLFFEARYEHGFMDWHSFKDGNVPKSYSSVMNRGFTFSVGYVIHLKKKSYDSEPDES